MNVYDFDDTIYQGDSTFDFIKECMKQPRCLVSMVVRSCSVIPFALHLWDKTKFKSYFFGFIRYINDIDHFLDAFVTKNYHKIKPWYIQQKKYDDVIISASPYFLIVGFCKKLGLTHIYGTDMDKTNGQIKGINCKDEAKVTLFRHEFGNEVIDEFYSDSKTDSPLARIATKAYLVKDNQRLDWPLEWL